MKLLGLLVEELPKHGGWPKWAEYAVKYETFEYINFYDQTGDAPLSFLSSHPSIYMGTTKYGERVTQEEYEAALAASQQPAWDGNGIPPVGCECELYSTEAGWDVVYIKYVGDKTIVLDLLDGDEYSYELSTCEFRPIRSEAERKREEAIDALYKSNGVRARDGGKQVAVDIYDAIAAGKIPGVTITK